MAIAIDDLIELLKKLTSVTLKGTQDFVTGTDQGAGLEAIIPLHFDESLVSNIETVHKTLTDAKKYSSLKRLYDKTLKENSQFEARQQYTACCLVILLYIKDKLSSKPTKKKPRQTAPDISLSVNQQKVIASTLEFIVSLGICPYYLPGVGIPLASRSDYGHLIHSSPLDESAKNSILHANIVKLLECMEHTSLKIIVTSNHLGDVLGALCQLSYSPNSHDLIKTDATAKSVEQDVSKLTVRDTVPPSGTPSEMVDKILAKYKTMSVADVRLCRSTLTTMVEKSYQPLVIRQLLLLHGSHNHSQKQPSPKWLRMLCNKLLSQCMTRINGVTNVIKAIVDDSKDLDWKHCMSIGQLIAKVPKHGITTYEYYKFITPQVLGLLKVKEEHQKSKYLRLCSCTMQCMLDVDMEVGKKIVFKDGLLLTLMPCISCTDYSGFESGTIVIPEKCLGRSLHTFRDVYVYGFQVNNQIIECITPIIHTLFKLMRTMYGGPCYLRPVCKEILIHYLKTCDTINAMQCLWLLVFEDWCWFNPHLELVNGDHGGMKCVVSSERDRSVWEDNDITITCVVELLQLVPKQKIVGEFFIKILKELSMVISSRMDPIDTTNSSAHNKVLLNMETKKTKKERTLFHNLKVLNLVAAMCDTIGPDCLINSEQTLLFIQVTLERGVQVCGASDDMKSDVFDKETISMALGLLTLVISGGMQLTESDKETMDKLVPLLDSISRTHPDGVLKSMAGNLRIAIATRGAVQPEDMEGFDENVTEDNGAPSTHRAHSTEHFVNKEDGDDKKPCIAKRSTSASKAPPRRSLSAYQQMLEELQDPLVPVRGHALITLKKLMASRDPETLSNTDTLMPLVQSCIRDEDSYVYLAAIQAMGEFSSVFPDTVIILLLKEYVSSSSKDNVELRIKVGEAVIGAIKNLGELVVKYRDILLSAVLAICKDDNPVMRASGLSNLAMLCKNLRFAVGPVLFEILNCCSSILKTDPDTIVKRGAALVLNLLLRGLGPNALTILGEAAKDIYHLLKHIENTEQDDILQVHIQLSLGELDTIMRDFIFPKQTLEKKIFVLDPPH